MPVLFAIMFEAAVISEHLENKLKVRDVAEIVMESLAE